MSSILEDTLILIYNDFRPTKTTKILKPNIGYISNQPVLQDTMINKYGPNPKIIESMKFIELALQPRKDNGI